MSELGAGGARRRAFWAVANQTANAGSNLILTIWVARGVSSTELGRFALAYTLTPVAIAMARALGSTVAILVPGDSDPERGRVRSWSLAVSLIAGLGVSAIALVLGGANVGGARSSFIVVALIAPVLTLQDTYIYLFMALGRARAAFLNNLLWLAVQVTLFGLCSWSGIGGTATLFAAWGAGAAVAALAAGLAIRSYPRIRGARAWVRRHKEISASLTAEAAVQQIGQQMLLWLIAGFAGVGAVGAFKVAEVSFGTARFLISGLTPAVLAEFVRLRSRGIAHLTRGVQLLACANAALMSACVAGLFVLPLGLGAQFFGASWSAAHGLLIPYGAFNALFAASLSFQFGLKTVGATRLAAKIRVPLTLGVPLIVAIALPDSSLRMSLALLVPLGFVDVAITAAAYTRRARHWRPL